ncbi:MAG TPA: acetoacetate decarboxylase family protein [Acidimicrobiales bacterium]
MEAGDDLGPPWRLVGEAILAFARVPRGERRRLTRLLPGGVRPLPLLPAVVVGVAYQDSPVGPYHELSIGLPGRIGLRPGMCVVLQVVDSPEARMAYRRLWGLPTDLGRFLWSRDGDERSMRWEERGVVVRGAPFGVRFPIGLPLRSLQRRADGPVVLPRRLWSLARGARVTIEVADPLSTHEADIGWLAGSHPGGVLSSMRVVASMARHPAGMLSSLRAPHPVAGAAIE